MAYLKVNQACKFLGISRGTIYKYVALGLLEVRREESGTDKIGKTIELKFHTDDLEKFKESLKKKVKRGQRLVV